MALEKGTYSPFSTPPPEAMEAPEMEEGEGEVLSMSLLGGQDVKPGDVVRIRVQAVNEDEGTFTGVYASDAKPKSSRLGDEMAMEKPMMEGAM